MYYIINKTKDKITKSYHFCSFIETVEEQLNNGDNIIIISMLSNTIKLPIRNVDGYLEEEWNWIDYPFPFESILFDYLTGNKRETI